MKKQSKWLNHFLIFIAIVIADRITKYFLYDGCLGMFCIKKALNSGASFGILNGIIPLFIITAAIVLVLIAVFYKKVDEKTKLALALIAAGTFSNMIDRMAFNGVIDLFSIFNSSAFNIADISNVAGGILLLISIFKPKKA